MCYEVYDSCNNLLGRNRWPQVCCPMMAHQWRPSVMYRVLLIFNVEELKYDIANVAYSQGDSVVTEATNTAEDRRNNEHHLHQWIDVIQDGNVDRVMRQMSVAVSECEQKLYKFTKVPMHGHMAMENMPKRGCEYLIELKVDQNFSETTVVALLHFIHDYIVARVLEDWAGVCVRPDFIEYWSNRRKELLEMIGKEGNRTDNSEMGRIMPSWC